MWVNYIHGLHCVQEDGGRYLWMDGWMKRVSLGWSMDYNSTFWQIYKLITVVLPPCISSPTWRFYALGLQVLSLNFYIHGVHMMCRHIGSLSDMMSLEAHFHKLQSGRKKKIGRLEKQVRNMYLKYLHNGDLMRGNRT